MVMCSILRFLGKILAVEKRGFEDSVRGKGLIRNLGSSQYCLSQRKESGGRYAANKWVVHSVHILQHNPNSWKMLQHLLK